jgi:hypothetical protein
MTSRVNEDGHGYRDHDLVTGPRKCAPSGTYLSMASALLKNYTVDNWQRPYSSFATEYCAQRFASANNLTVQIPFDAQRSQPDDRVDRVGSNIENQSSFRLSERIGFV